MNTPLIRSTLPVAVLALAIAGNIFTQDATGKPSVALTDPVEVIGSVEIVGEAHKTPFIARETVYLNQGQSGHYKEFTLPPGKRLVIETVTAVAEVAVGSKPRGSLDLSFLHASSGGTLPLSFTEEGPWSGRIVWHATSASRIRVDTDDYELGFSFYRPGTAWASYTVTIFGYLEDL